MECICSPDVSDPLFFAVRVAYGNRHIASLASVRSSETALERARSDLSERTRQLDEYSASQVRPT